MHLKWCENWTKSTDVYNACVDDVLLCDTVLLFFVCPRSVCLDSVQTNMETGTTTGRRTIWPELSDTQESMMEITNIMSPCCWQTSTKSECLKADDDIRMTSQWTTTVGPFSFSSLKLTFIVNSIDKLTEILSWNNREGKRSTATFFGICNPSSHVSGSEHTEHKPSCQQACYP